MQATDTAAVLAAIDAMRARADAATPGPWIEDDCFVHGGEIQSGDRWARRELIANCGQERDESDADADFIAHARADVPLLAAVARAAVEWSAARREYSALGDQEGHFSAEDERRLYDQEHVAADRLDAALAALATAHAGGATGDGE